MRRMGRWVWGLGVAILLVMTGGLSLSQCGPVPAGKRYYVDSVRGSDEQTGTAPNEAWQTLAPVHAHRFRPGDTIHLACGSTWTTGLLIDDSGLEGQPITLRAYGSGPRPVLSARGRGSRAVSIEASWVVLEGLAVRDAHEFGVCIGEGAQHNTIRDCEITQVGIGLGVYGDWNRIIGNWVHDLKMVVSTPGGNDDYGAYAVGLYGADNEVAYNRMQRCRAPSEDYGTDGGAVEIHGEAHRNRIHHNLAIDNHGFIEVGGGAACDTVVAYNVSLRNGGFSMIHLAGEHRSEVARFRVEYNVILEQRWSGQPESVFRFDGERTGDAFTERRNVIWFWG